METEVTEENPSYYGILPADVRYCKNLSFGEKVLYTEISSLSNMRGYCFANNSYFANLYDVHKNTISKWISNLEDNGFIVCFDEIRKNKSIERRIKLDNINSTKKTTPNDNPINPTIYPHKPYDLPPSTVGFTPINPTVYHNSTSLILPINNSNNTVDFQKNENLKVKDLDLKIETENESEQTQLNEKEKKEKTIIAVGASATKTLVKDPLQKYIDKFKEELKSKTDFNHQFKTVCFAWLKYKYNDKKQKYSNTAWVDLFKKYLDKTDIEYFSKQVEYSIANNYTGTCFDNTLDGYKPKLNTIKIDDFDYGKYRT